MILVMGLSDMAFVMLRYVSFKGLPSVLVVKNLQETREMQVRSMGQEDPLEEGMAIDSSMLVRKIPWTEKPGRVEFMGLQRVGHD